MKHASHWLAILVLTSAVLVAAWPAGAQFNPSGPGPGLGSLFDSSPADAKSVVSIEARFTAPSAGQPGRLLVTAKIKSGWHIYSITQPPGGPIATKIAVSPPPGVRVTGPFQAQPAPDKKQEPAFDNLTVETHHDTVTWSAPIELAAGVDPAKLKIEGTATVQACDANSCLPPTPIAFAAAWARGTPPPEQPAAAPPVDLAALLVPACLGVCRGNHSQSDALRPAGDQPEDSRLRGASRREPRTGFRPERVVLGRDALRVSGAGRVGAPPWDLPGASNSPCRGSRSP